MAFAPMLTLLATMLLGTPLQETKKPENILNQTVPELIGSDWMNAPEGKPITMKGLRGKSVVVHYFANRCINCRRNMAAYGRLQKEFKKRDVVLFGIHTPELPGENDPKEIQGMLDKYGVKFPVLRDGDGANWRAWKQQVWPTVYLIDKKGVVRDGWQGELAWEGAEGEARLKKNIRTLLAEK